MIITRQVILPLNKPLLLIAEMLASALTHAGALLSGVFESCLPVHPASGSSLDFGQFWCLFSWVEVQLSAFSPIQETLDALRQAMRNTRILCAVMLDTKVMQLSWC